MERNNLYYLPMLHQLMSEKWALEERLHERMALLALADKLDFKSFSEGRKGPEVAMAMTMQEGLNMAAELATVARAGASYYRNLPKLGTKAGMVAVVPLIGAMSRYGDYCSWGTEDISGWLLEAYNDDAVVGVVLEVNSGGGAVDGTELLAQVVRQRNKPVVSLVTGMAASAAYWVASQTDEIIMESATASEVGSIGVLAMHVDASKAYEKQGFKPTIIRADGSEGKALFNSLEPLTPELIAQVKAELAPIREEFIRQVKAGRPEITNDGVFAGGMYAGAVAIQNGMADRIGYLGDAVQRVVYLAA